MNIEKPQWSLNRLRWLVTVASALCLLMTSHRTQAEWWGTSEFILADSGLLYIMDTNFKVLRAEAPCGSGFPCGSLAGSLDWFPNGDLMVASRFSEAMSVARFNRAGEQTHYYAPGPNFLWPPQDTKLSFNGGDIYAAAFGGAGGEPTLRRFGLDPRAAYESQNWAAIGGLAVVPRLSGRHELWFGLDPFWANSVIIFELCPTGEIDFEGKCNSGSFGDGPPEIGAACSTMSYDPAAHRVLFSNLHEGKIYAMDVETRTLAQTYAVPDDQRDPLIEFTGITTGPGGMVVAVESYALQSGTRSFRRVGLSVWDADGSNYRFINLEGIIFINRDSGIYPKNILWTGHSPEFRNHSPILRAPEREVLDCAPPSGIAVDITAEVTDPDAGQSLTVSLQEAGFTLQEQTVSTPADNLGLTFTGILLEPGEHKMTIEVADGARTVRTEFTIVINRAAPPQAGPQLPEITVECDGSLPPFGVPSFRSDCDRALDVTSSEEELPISGREVRAVRRTWVAKDDIGQWASTSQTIIISDTTAPVISNVSAPITVAATSLSGAQATFAPPTAIDACAGQVNVTCVPESGARFPVGKTSVLCTAVDHVGNISTASFDVTVNPLPPVSWSGVLQPLNADGTSIYRLGSVVPVKFQLTGASSGRTDLVAQLSYLLIDSNGEGAINEADVPGSATVGNQFKYDPATDQYQFNWSTRQLSQGKYKLLIDLGDGSIRTVRVVLQ